MYHGNKVIKKTKLRSRFSSLNNEKIDNLFELKKPVFGQNQQLHINYKKLKNYTKCTRGYG